MSASQPNSHARNRKGLVPVVAILVVREHTNGYVGPTLRQAVQSIQQQTVKPELLVIADTSEDGHVSRQLMRDLQSSGSSSSGREGELEVTHLAVPTELVDVSNKNNFGQAIEAALNKIGPQPNRTEWYWLLHDDMVADGSALEELLAATTASETIAVVGPKQVGYEHPDTLLSLGIDATGSARRVFKTEPDEIDQGQHDAREDVLAVGTAGALVRKKVWETIGGLDRALGPFGDGLEFGRRVRLGGYRVVVAPRAVVQHDQAAYGEDEVGTASFPRRRSEQIYNWLVALPAWQLLPAMLWLPILTVLRTIGRLVTGKPKLAGAEIKAYLGTVGMTVPLLKARRRLRQVSVIPRRALDTLTADPAGIRTYRRTRRRISSDKDETPTVLDVGAQASLRRHTTQTFGGLLALVALVGTVSWVAWAPYSGGIQGGLWGSLPGKWGTLVAEAFSGWQLMGDGLAGAGSPLLAVFAVLAAPFALLGVSPTTVGLGAYYLAVPLAAWAGWALAATFTRSVSVKVAVGTLWVGSPAFILPLVRGDVPTVVLYLAAVPAFIGLWRAIRPPLALRSGGATDILKAPNPDRISWLALGVLAAVVASAAAPLMLFLVAAYSLVLALTSEAGWAGSQANATHFPASKATRAAAVLLPAVFSATLLGPTGVQAFQAGGWPRLLTWVLGPYSHPSGVLGLFGSPNRPPIAWASSFQAALTDGQFPQVIIALMLLPGAITLLWVAGILLFGWGRAGHGRLLAFVFGAVGLWAAGYVVALIQPGVPTALLVAGLLLITATIPAAYADYQLPAYAHKVPRQVRFARASRRMPSTIAIVGGLAALTAAMVFGPTGSWANQRVAVAAETLANPLLQATEENAEAEPAVGITAVLSDPHPLISPAASPAVPLISQDAQASPRAGRLLALHFSKQEVRAALLRGPGPLVADVYRQDTTRWSSAVEAEAASDLEEAIARLVAGVDGNAVQTLSEHAVDAVLVGADPQVAAEVHEAFDQTSGLERVGTVGEAAMWRVRPEGVAPSRVSAHRSSGIQVVPSGAVGVATDYVSEGPAVLVLAELADPGWKATLDGVPLNTKELEGSGSWRQAFDLPDVSGRLTVTYSQPYLPVWWVLLGLLLAATLILAVPWGARRASFTPVLNESDPEEPDEPEEPTGLVNLVGGQEPAEAGPDRDGEPADEPAEGGDESE